MTINSWRDGVEQGQTVGLLKPRRHSGHVRGSWLKNTRVNTSKGEGWNAHVQTACMWVAANWWRRTDIGFYCTLLDLEEKETHLRNSGRFRENKHLDHEETWPQNLALGEESEASFQKVNAILRNKLPGMGLAFISL